jgi:hypothetical protein
MNVQVVGECKPLGHASASKVVGFKIYQGHPAMKLLASRWQIIATSGGPSLKIKWGPKWEWRLYI